MSRGCGVSLAGAFLAAVFAFLLLGALGANVNHDEHQFVAPAAVMSRSGAVPYKDFPLFHLPNQVLLHAGLTRLADQPFLVARLTASVCAFGVTLFVFFSAWRQSTIPAIRSRLLFASAAVGFLVLDPLFAFTTGRAWNHDTVAFLVIAAIALQVRAARNSSLTYCLASGMMAGLAAGFRITAAPLLVPLCLSIFLFQTSWRHRILLATAYTAAATAALAPSWFFLANYSDQFLFGNFEFPRLRLLDPSNERIQKTMHPLRKVRFFFKEVALPSLPIFLLYLGITVNALRRRALPFGGWLVLGMLPFALLGCFAPSRYQYQHYFLLIPLLVMGAIYGLHRTPTFLQGRGKIVAIPLLFIGLTYYATATYISEAERWRLHPSRWITSRTFALSQQIRAQVPSGPILTLGPIAVLEAGGEIYPEFATAPFGWKSAPFVSLERRPLLKMLSARDLDGFLASRPPAGILTGVEQPALEAPIVEYAKTHGFEMRRLDGKRRLWLPPK